MTPLRLRNSPPPGATTFTGVTPQKAEEVPSQQQAGNAGASSQVSSQLDGFEAAPAKAQGPALQPATFTDAAAQPQAALQPGGSSNLQQEIDFAAQSKDWKKPAPVMAQTTLDNCGPAAAAMLARSAGSFGEQHLSDAELMQRIGSGYLNREGPGGVQVKDMGFMLNNAGLVIDSAASPEGAEVEGYMLDRLQSGQKLMALLDGHTLEGVQGEGVSSHWVVIDGVDDNGNFVVKDPALGKALSVDAATISASLANNQRETGSSGFLAIEPKTQFGADRSHGLINGAAGVGSDPISDGLGGGSRIGTSSGSRESTGD